MGKRVSRIGKNIFKIIKTKNGDVEIRNFATKYPFLSAGYLNFSFILPTCFYLDKDYDFLVYLSNWENPFVVNTEEVIEGYDSRYGTSHNVEVVSDVAGAFRLTRLNIFFQDKEPYISLEKIRSLYERDVIKVANHFIDAYRYLTGRYAISNVFNLSSVRDLLIKRGDKNGKEKFLISLEFGKGAVLTPFSLLRSREEHINLQELTIKDSPIPLEDLFLMDAKRHASTGHDLQAIISGVTALELAVSSVETHIDLKIWERLLVFFLRYSNLQTRIKKILTQNVNAPKGLLGNVIFAIRERNRVVHGRKRTLKGDIEKHLQYIETAIKYIRNHQEK